MISGSWSDESAPIENYFDAKMNVKEMLMEVNRSPLRDGITQIIAIILALYVLGAQGQPALASAASFSDAQVTVAATHLTLPAMGLTVPHHANLLVGSRSW